jgi:hypothetical protein
VWLFDFPSSYFVVFRRSLPFFVTGNSEYFSFTRCLSYCFRYYFFGLLSELFFLVNSAIFVCGSS